MNFELFVSLIRNLLHMTVTELTEEGCRDFAASYCFLPELQDIYTSSRLQELVRTARPEELYDLRDLLEVNALVLQTEERTFLIGPYVSREFMEVNYRSLLLENGFAASVLPALKLYISDFPLYSRKAAADTLLAVMKSLAPLAVPASIVPVRCGRSSPAAAGVSRQEGIDYAPVYRRYERENRFLSAIENGDTDALLPAFENLNTFGLDSRRYVSAIYQEPAVALAILRTLARKAAERGGASVVEIDEITQRATQAMMSAHSLYQAQDLTGRMLRELTEAVRRSRDQLAGLSAPIRKTAEYIRLHFSQELSLAELAETAGLSETYFSSRFRKETGQTVTAYLAGLRISQAARLLRESDMPVQEISSFVGYSDNNYFSKVFRRYMGMTPRAYRESPEGRSVDLSARFS